MLLGSSSALPAIQPSNLYTFYPYSLTHPAGPSYASTSRRSSSIRGEVQGSIQPTRRGDDRDSQPLSSPLTSPRAFSPAEHQQSPVDHHHLDQPGSSSSRAGSDWQAKEYARQALRKSAAAGRKRAENRALMGLRPAGLAMGRESEELDIEEIAMDDERVSHLTPVLILVATLNGWQRRTSAQN